MLYTIRSFFKKIKYFFYCEYTTIKLKDLTNEYHDNVARYFYACWAILCDYVENDRFYSNYKFQKSRLDFPFRDYFTSNEIKRKYGEEGIVNEIEALKKYLTTPPWEDATEDAIKQHNDSITLQIDYMEEILFLYRWYKDNYLKRQEPFDKSGLSDFHEKIRKAGRQVHTFVKCEDSDNFTLGSTLTKDEQEEYDILFKVYSKILLDYEQEEDEMLERLLKVRKFLWI